MIPLEKLVKSGADGIMGLRARVAMAQGRIDEAMAGRDSALRLASIWIERERNYRAQAAEYRNDGNAVEMRVWENRAEAVKRCRLDLQWQFALVRRLGAGPMTDAECKQYVAEEMRQRGGREEQL